MCSRNKKPVALYKRPVVYDQCIEQLSRLHGKVKLWRDAVAQARGEARRRNDRPTAMNEMQREAELLRQFGSVCQGKLLLLHR